MPSPDQPLSSFIVDQGGAAEIYENLKLGAAKEVRPYTLIDMVATIDGKTVSGDRSESVVDLGSKVDHALLRKVESAVDAALIGASTLRATSPNWQPRARTRFALSRSGYVDYESAFFKGGAAYVVCFGKPEVMPPSNVGLIEAQGPADLMQHARDMGIERLLILGGSETNAQFLAEDLVDELFITIAPKVKLGAHVPTFAGGEPLSREQMLQFELIEHHVVENEVFLRYRRLEPKE